MESDTNWRVQDGPSKAGLAVARRGAESCDSLIMRRRNKPEARMRTVPGSLRRGRGVHALPLRIDLRLKDYDPIEEAQKTHVVTMLYIRALAFIAALL